MSRPFGVTDSAKGGNLFAAGPVRERARARKPRDNGFRAGAAVEPVEPVGRADSVVEPSEGLELVVDSNALQDMGTIRKAMGGSCRTEEVYGACAYAIDAIDAINAINGGLRRVANFNAQDGFRKLSMGTKAETFPEQDTTKDRFQMYEDMVLEATKETPGLHGAECLHDFHLRTVMPWILEHILERNKDCYEMVHLPPLDKTAKVSDWAFMDTYDPMDAQKCGGIGRFSPVAVEQNEADFMSIGNKSSLASLFPGRDGNQNHTLQRGAILSNLSGIMPPNHDSNVMRGTNGSDGTGLGTTADTNSFIAMILTKFHAGPSKYTPKLLLPVLLSESNPNRSKVDLKWERLSDLDQIITDLLLDNLINPIKSVVAIGNFAGTADNHAPFIAKRLAKWLASAIEYPPKPLLSVSLFTSAVSALPMPGSTAEAQADWRSRAMDVLTDKIVALAQALVPTLVTVLALIAAQLSYAYRNPGLSVCGMLVMGSLFTTVRSPQYSSAVDEEHYTLLSFGLGYTFFMVAYCKLVVLHNRGGRMFSVFALLMALFGVFLLMSHSSVQDYWNKLTGLPPMSAVAIAIPLAFNICDIVVYQAQKPADRATIQAHAPSLDGHVQHSAPPSTTNGGTNGGLSIVAGIRS